MDQTEGNGSNPVNPDREHYRGEYYCYAWRQGDTVISRDQGDTGTYTETENNGSSPVNPDRETREHSYRNNTTVSAMSLLMVTM